MRTIRCASGFDTHLNWLTLNIVWFLKVLNPVGVPLGLVSRASAHASVGAEGVGVPVISHRRALMAITT